MELETSISARIHTRNRTLEEIVLELLQKEPICFEGKSYNTLVQVCAGVSSAALQCF